MEGFISFVPLLTIIAIVYGVAKFREKKHQTEFVPQENPIPLHGNSAKLKKCKDCGHGISKKATTCPQCGAPAKRQPVGCGGGLVLIVLVAILGSIISQFFYSTHSDPVYETQTPIVAKKSTPKRLESQTIEGVYLDPDYLEIGSTYTLSKQTPIMPTPNPETVKETFSDIEKMKYAQIGDKITILNRLEVGQSQTWYQVNSNVGKGWVNSLALIGQDFLTE